MDQIQHSVRTSSGRVSRPPMRYGQKQWFSPYVIPMKNKPQRRVDYLSMDKEDREARQIEEIKKSLFSAINETMKEVCPEIAMDDSLVKTLEIDFDVELPNSQEASADSFSQIPNPILSLEELENLDQELEGPWLDQVDKQPRSSNEEIDTMEVDQEEEQTLPIPPFRDPLIRKYAGKDEEWEGIGLGEFPRFHIINYPRISMRIHNMYFL